MKTKIKESANSPKKKFDICIYAVDHEGKTAILQISGESEWIAFDTKDIGEMDKFKPYDLFEIMVGDEKYIIRKKMHRSDVNIGSEDVAFEIINLNR